jgi:Flp pilus assembly secretin CpaC
MTCSSWRRRPGLTGLALCLLYGVAAAEPAAPVDPLVVFLDQARIVKMPENVSTLVIGNPLIADVSVQGGGIMVLTGKGYGVTNLVALDRAGKMLMNEAIQVKGATDSVVIYRGADRESYSCTPDCDRRITLGDEKVFFDETLRQGTMRSQSAQSAAAGPGISR